MVGIDIDPFSSHDKTEEPMGETVGETAGETIPLNPGGRGATWEPGREQQTSFGIESQRIRLMTEDVKRLYQMLSEEYQLPEERHFDMF